MSLLQVFVALSVAVSSVFGQSVDLHQDRATTPSIPELSVITSPAPGTEYVNMDKKVTCSFGFKGERNGDIGYITAGHCGDAGDTIAITTPQGRVEVGEFTWSLGSPVTSGLPDLAFIKIHGRVNAEVARVKDTPVMTLDKQDMENAKPDLCKVGPKTKDTCGEILTDIFTSGTVSFEAKSLHGDSGSPVFAQVRGGGLAAVGILSGSPVGVEGEIIAQLLDNETLSRYNLKVSNSWCTMPSTLCN